MVDNLKKRGRPDRMKIHTKQPHEMRYWTKKLGVTSQAIVGAVRATGSNRVVKIQKYLQGK